jgi:NADPH:quinone reductase-like Zn-dependent oxidoreductase
MGRKGDLLALWKFVESGELKGVVDSTFPLKEAAAAQRRMEGRQHFGKIVLQP